jgi:lysophospholipase L1-like esterase
MTFGRRAAVLAAGNVAVTLLLLLAANIASLAVLSLYRATRTIHSRSVPVDPAPDPRHRMPAYRDDAEAIVFWTEFGELESRYEPFIGWRRMPYRGQAITIDQTGRRTFSPASVVPDTAPTVHFFGGSTMWGTGAPDSGTIPAQFSALYPGVHVVNHAEHGFTSRQALDQLITLVDQGKSVENVVFYDGANDVAAQCHRAIPVPGHFQVVQIRSALELRRQTMQGEPRSFRQQLARDVYDLLLKHTIVLGQGLLERLGLRRPPTEFVPPARWPAGEYDCHTDSAKAGAVARALFANWEIAHLIVTSRGGAFLAFLQPNAYVGSPENEYLTQDWLNPELKQSFDAVYPLIRKEIGTGRYSWAHDLSTAFDGAGRVYVDDFHVTERGNAIVAQHIAGHFAELVKQAQFWTTAVGIPGDRYDHD